MPRKPREPVNISTEITTSHGNKRYMVYTSRSLYGKVIRRYCSTKGEAKQAREHLLNELKGGGSDAGLSLGARRDAERAIALAKNRVSLERAVDYWVMKHPENSISTEEALGLFIASRSNPLEVATPLKPSSIAALQKTLKNFCHDMDCPVSEIEEEDIRDWLDDDWSASTSRFHLINLKTFFGWLRKKKRINENPAEEILTPSHDHEEPVEILTVAQVERALKVTQTDFPECAPAVALAFFSGIRTSELRKLDWSEIAFEADGRKTEERYDGQGRYIDILAAKSKTRQRRQIPMFPVLYYWLETHRQESGRVVPPGWRDKWYQIKRATMPAETPWPRNGARHSFASYFLSEIGTEHQCARAMGNTPDIVVNHYRGIVKSRSNAERFWALAPDKIN